MHFYLVETRSSPAGHEIDYDRLIIEELTALGHQVSLVLPAGLNPKTGYACPTIRLKSSGFYSGPKLFKSLWAEISRQKIYRELAQLASGGAMDAFIFPSATYRFLRALRINPFKHCPKPIFFIIHGLAPQETPKLLGHLKRLAASHSKAKALLHTLGPEKWAATHENLIPLEPPLFIPRDLKPASTPENNPEILKLGFFGQYRREKKLPLLVEAFKKAEFNRPVELIIQGAFPNPAAKEEFEQVMAANANTPNLTFIPRPLIGLKWQEALSSVQVILITYAAHRYLWHWSAVLFNALGYRKPVIASETINPELFARFKVGLTFDSQKETSLTKALEDMVNGYAANYRQYEQAIAEAQVCYAPRKIAEKLAELADRES